MDRELVKKIVLSLGGWFVAGFVWMEICDKAEISFPVALISGLSIAGVATYFMTKGDEKKRYDAITEMLQEAYKAGAETALKGK